MLVKKEIIALLHFCMRYIYVPDDISHFLSTDAFEFYTRLTEQIDDYLKGQRHERVFAHRFEGVYSIQRICQDCPHRFVL